MALSSYALTSLARQKEFMGITANTFDTVLTALINSTTEFIENYCDRRFESATYTNEVYDGTGSSQLLLRQFPVTTFTRLQRRDTSKNESSWSTLETEDYFVKLTEGIVIIASNIYDGWNDTVSYTTNFRKYPQYYRATYVAGLAFDVGTGTYLEDVGAGDLEYVVWKLVTTMFNQRRGSDDVSSEKIGEYSVTYRKEVSMDTELRQILNFYRRPPSF